MVSEQPKVGNRIMADGCLRDPNWGDSPPCVQRSKMNSALQLLAVLQASLGGISRWGGELR